MKPNRKKAEQLCSFFAAPNDYLARRRTNTAPTARPNIDLSAIETGGISLEQLGDLNVPVYRYTTQITIHGVWDDTLGYCLGYKYLTKNKNSSIGIRYGAIDGAKKQHLRELCQYSKFSSSHNSTDDCFYISFHKEHKSRALKVYNYLQQHKNLFIGNVSALYDPMFTGRYYVLIDLAAIPESSMKLFEQKILKVTPLKIKLVDARREARRARRQAEDEARQAEHKKLVGIAKAAAVDCLLSAGFQPITPNGKDYRGIIPTYDRESYTSKDYHPAYRLIEVKRRAFGPCYKSITSKNLEALKEHQFDWSKKSRRLTKQVATIYAA